MERQAFRRMNHAEINYDAFWLEVVGQLRHLPSAPVWWTNRFFGRRGR